ncbi:MAG: DUF3284 domain-containing protein [Streptococcaceae bacterium]|jgi:hypothetical protein|nr:DUF3284 domain-containing protein [Streptococcaceae bacterium]
MQATRKMNIDAKSFFDMILTSAKYDIEQSTKEAIALEDIKTGFTYKKDLTNKVGKMGDSITTLTTVDVPFVYEASFKTARGINTVSYKVEQLSDGINVTYSEDYIPATSTLQLNNKIVSIFFKRSNKKRMKGMLKMMEEHLLKQVS